MLRIEIIAIGRDKEVWVTQAARHYQKLLSRYADVSLKAIAPPRRSESHSPSEIRSAEAVLIGNNLGKGYTVALSDAGKKLDSAQMAKWLEKLQLVSHGHVNFIIGGPHGLDAGFVDRCDFVLSLSPLTFPHQLVRIILLEQLYRSFSILHGTDYHK